MYSVSPYLLKMYRIDIEIPRIRDEIYKINNAINKEYGVRTLQRFLKYL